MHFWHTAQIIARLSRKLRIFAAVLYQTKHAAWKAGYRDFGFM